jgi:hypothetical protein
MYLKKLILINFCVLLCKILIGQNGVVVAKLAFPYTVSIILQDEYKKPLGLGSGFIIAPGKVITNVHVVEGARYGEIVEDKNKTIHKIQGYSAIDRKNDLIILSVPTITKNGIKISDTLPEVGENIFAIGNPRGLSGTISEGIVSGVRLLENNDLFQITAPVSPGSSGGPVLNRKGEVIGVSVASLTSGQNLNFAIPNKYVIKLISSDKDIITKLNIPFPQRKTTAVVVQEGVFVSDILWKESRWNDNKFFDEYLYNLSITNSTENTVCCIETVAIVYKNNIPIDYFEFTLFPDSEYGNKDLGKGPIKPFLGKSIVLDDRTLWNFRCRSENDFMFNKNLDERVVFRILNYSILN